MPESASNAHSESSVAILSQSQYVEPTAVYRPSNPNLFSVLVVEGPGEPPPVGSTKCNRRVK